MSIPDRKLKSYRPRLSLRIIWHEAFLNGAALANHVYSALCRDVTRPASRGIGIPVYFHYGHALPDGSLPTIINPESAISTVVVPLIDDNIRADNIWINCLNEVQSALQSAGRGHLFLPVACSERAHRISKEIGAVNFIPLHTIEFARRPEKLVSALTHELCRLLMAKIEDVVTPGNEILEKSYAPVKLFISHAKQDGIAIAEELRDYVQQNLPLATFFDSNDVGFGSKFGREIEANVAESALVVVHTDAYSSREWCRREVLLAKRYGCPIAVVNALNKGEDRTFPYLGNAPTIRWTLESPSRCEVVIDLALREVLKNVYFEAHVKTLKQGQMLSTACVEVGTAPEVLTYLNLVRRGKCSAAEPTLILYPDPPLGDEEVEIVSSLNRTLTLATPTSSAVLSVAQPAGHSAIYGKLIGLSISASPKLGMYGLTQLHLEDAMVEFARHFLALGASLAYGGDLRPGGFTRILFDLVRVHNEAGGDERIRNYLAWPFYLNIDKTQWANFNEDALFKKVAPPVDLRLDEAKSVAPDTADGRYIWARCLTKMREEMNGDIHARILVGGQVQGFKGRYPGLLEEALLALRKELPLYLVGGFGGCSLAVIRAIGGKKPQELTRAFHQSDKLFDLVTNKYQTNATDTHRLDYDAEVEFLEAKGVAGLANGLSAEENEVLFTSTNLPEIVFLILKGLNAALEPPKP